MLRSKGDCIRDAALADWGGGRHLRSED